MDRKQAKEAVRERIEDYLTSKGINTRRAFLCLNPAHDDRHPSMGLDRRNMRVHCFQCGARYDIFDLIGIDYGLTDSKAKFDKGYELYGITVEEAPSKSAPVKDVSKMGDKQQNKNTQIQSSNTAPTHTQKINTSSSSKDDRTGYYKACRDRISQTDYPALRGLSAGTLERHYIGYDPAFKTQSAAGEFVQWKALIIPTGKGSFAVRNTDPGAGKKDRYRKRGNIQIFGYKALYRFTCLYRDL